MFPEARPIDIDDYSESSDEDRVGSDSDSCSLCDYRPCTGHPQAKFYDYPAWKETPATTTVPIEIDDGELQLLAARLNVEALRSRAMALRRGKHCTISPLLGDSRARRGTKIGGMNVHLTLQFEDGISWIARIRRINASSPPPAVCARIIESEAATLRFLANTGVPVPRAHDFGIEGPANRVGVGYILMDKLEGVPLQWFQYDVFPEKKVKILDQLADIFIELERYPFPRIGSLFNPGSPQIGPCASAFDTAAHSSGITFGSAMYRKAVTKTHTYPIISPKSSPEPAQEYFLKHMDDKGDHILIDEDCNVVGIIDWEWAQTVPKAEAFAAPLFLWDTTGVDDGADELLFAEALERKGGYDLAMLVRNSVQRHQARSFCGEREAERAYEIPPDVLEAAELAKELSSTELEYSDEWPWESDDSFDDSSSDEADNDIYP
ncbi:hypothetical protein BOTBODRAFT_31627 [Botryobasidium botryosum FD-172 SS1]|uniref:Aminoglycoside phosphotransferase domain-containing protein n=1 Tax=Botryobasidium botryosum (strain FD-172 SS1) TaxID=930990 RepID=A0A067MV47_BOTB1|nr:hypothetical protein BOTBODRAFT_31627 [Botryobasidium botryosum FD-172 SS1]